jgi:molybdate transport system substrate-binding protein
VATLADLARPGLKLVSTSKEVPIGAYTLEALGKLAADAQYGAGYMARVLANVVSEEGNVRQIVTKVQLGEADAGFVYASDVTPRAAADVRTLEIPERFQPAAEHLIGVTRGAKAPVLAQRFVEYVLGPAGQAILQKHGFIPLR